jgi:hypothetical protein
VWFKRVLKNELVDLKLEVDAFCVVEAVGLTKV